jgi:hypothetical protein
MLSRSFGGRPAEDPIDPASPSDAPAEDPTATSSPSDGFIRYQDPDGHFAVSYPEDWYVEERGPGTIFTRCHRLISERRGLRPELHDGAAIR